MRLPKWLKRQGTKNLFEASMVIDNADIKLIEAKYDRKPVLLAIGTSKQRELNVSGKGSTQGIGAEYKIQKDLEWKVYFNPKTLPDFIPIDKLDQVTAGTISVASAGAASFSGKLEKEEITKESLNKVIFKIHKDRTKKVNKEIDRLLGIIAGEEVGGK